MWKHVRASGRDLRQGLPKRFSHLGCCLAEKLANLIQYLVTHLSSPDYGEAKFCACTGRRFWEKQLQQRLFPLLWYCLACSRRCPKTLASCPRFVCLALPRPFSCCSTRPIAARPDLVSRRCVSGSVVH